MGSCAGKASSSQVVKAQIQPVDPQDSNAPNPYNEPVSTDNDNYQASQLNNPQNQQSNNPKLAAYQDSQDDHQQYQQPQPQNTNNVHPTVKQEEKLKNKEQGIIDDFDEDDFADQFKKKEVTKMSPIKTTEKKQENNIAGEAFALNFPGNQFATENAKKDNKAIVEENKRYQSKNKEKKLKNIIDNPDELEQSFSSQGDLAKALEKDHDDDFDVVENVKQKSHRDNYQNPATNNKYQEPLSNSSSQQNVMLIHEEKKSNRMSLAESASPMSGVIKNKTPEKAQELRESAPHVQENHEIKFHNHDKEPHEIKFHDHDDAQGHNEIQFHNHDEDEDQGHHEIQFHNHDEGQGHNEIKYHQHHGEIHVPPVQEHHEVQYHHEKPHISEREVHHKEEKPVAYHEKSDRDDIAKIKSPANINETKNKKIDEERMTLDDDDPLKIIDTPKKKDTSPPKHSVKVSQEKMPWERNSVPVDDENEIEFFDDELES